MQALAAVVVAANSVVEQPAPLPNVGLEAVLPPVVVGSVGRVHHRVTVLGSKVVGSKLVPDSVRPTAVDSEEEVVVVGLEAVVRHAVHLAVVGSKPAELAVGLDGIKAAVPAAAAAPLGRRKGAPLPQRVGVVPLAAVLVAESLVTSRLDSCPSQAVAAAECLAEAVAVAVAPLVNQLVGWDPHLVPVVALVGAEVTSNRKRSKRRNMLRYWHASSNSHSHVQSLTTSARTW